MDFVRWTSQAVEAARRAGAIIRTALGTGSVEVNYKYRFDPVTAVDLESQKLIKEIVLTYNPDHDFIGEEGVSHKNNSDFTWIVDPLDGTKNFAHGYPHVAVSIALQYRSQIVVGVVYDPVRDEMFVAWRGGGAFLNDRAVQVSQTSSLEYALLVTGFGQASETDRDVFWALEQPSQGVRRDGSAALDLCYVACGRLDAYFQRRLKPWDVAAASLIVEEAQGMITDYSGRPFALNAGELLASNVSLHAQVLEKIRPFLLQQ